MENTHLGTLGTYTSRNLFKGWALAMETESVDHIFRGSVELHNLRYTEYTVTYASAEA